MRRVRPSSSMVERYWFSITASNESGYRYVQFVVLAPTAEACEGIVRSEYQVPDRYTFGCPVRHPGFAQRIDGTTSFPPVVAASSDGGA